MKELPKGAAVNCEQFLNELEGLPTDGPRGATAAMWLRQLPDGARDHAARCAECAGALEDLAETRQALERMPELLPEAGPWFTRQVMHAIGAREEEIEERKSGFWNSVRRLAPRLVAFATLLLMLGGTWAFQVRRASRTEGPTVGSTEGIFEALPTTPANVDDVIVIVHEERAQ